MTENFDKVNQLLGNINPTIGLPIFSFREIRSTRKYETCFGKYEVIIFPREELPTLCALQVLQVDAVYTLVTKWVQLHQIS